MNNPVGWFELYVDDMQRAKDFYEAVFETKLEKLDVEGDLEMWNFPMNPEGKGCPGALVKMDGFGPGGSGTMIYFSSEDCAVEEQRIQDAGGKVETPKQSIGQYGFITIATDTEGNVFGIHSQK